MNTKRRTLVAILITVHTSLSALDAGDWPCWRGPEGSGCATPSGKALVDDLADMKLVWRSEELGIPANCWHNETQGGYDSPIVANGKVFISYFQGTGDILDTSIKADKRSQAVATEDIVLCADAATGKTQEKLDYCLTSTPALAGGFMYFRGSDSLYCYDLRK